MSFDTVATDEHIQTAKQALEANGFKVVVTEDGEAAKQSVLSMIPKGSEVLAVTSQTTNTIGLAAAINESGDYDAVMPKLVALMGDPSKKREQRKLGAAPEYVVGSVHAITQDGKALIASNTGSQLPAYAYGAEKVIWVVGAQKIVADLDEANKRLVEHVFPLENERAKQAYGSDTNISKLLTVHKEISPGRITVVIVKQALGF
jgi:L-lactate utilization protein LutC